MNPNYSDLTIKKITDLDQKNSGQVQLAIKQKIKLTPPSNAPIVEGTKAPLMS